MRLGARPTSALVGIALAVFASRVSADAAPLPPPGQYGSFGLNLGWAAHPVVSSGGQLGAELSFPHLFEDILWAGVYGDVLRDFGERSTKFSFGPEFGLGPFGFDGGLLIRTGDASARYGFQVRGMLTFALFAIYAGFARVPNDQEDDGFAQVGLLLKLPFPIWEDESFRRHRYHGQDVPPPPPPPPAPSDSATSSPAAPAESGRWATPPP